LNGTIPSELGRLTKLVELVVSENELSGTIPSELGNLVQAESMRFESNEGLNGTVPVEVCDLRTTGISDSNRLQDLRVRCDGESASVVCACCDLCRM
jgi:hypothetical protein